MLAFRVAARLHYLVRLDPQHPPGVREEQEPVMSGCHKKVFNNIVGPQLGALDALAATMLRAIVVAARSLDVSAAGDGDHHFFFGNQVFEVHVAAVAGHDLRSPLIAVLINNLGEFVGDNRPLTLWRGQDALEVRNLRFQLGSLVDNLLPLQCRESAQLHLENRPGLQVVNTEKRHEPLARVVDGGALSNERDDLIEGIERGEVAAQNVHALFGLLEAECGATHNDVNLVRDPRSDKAVECQRTRNAVNNRQHVRAKVLLKRRVLVEVIEHNLRHRVTLENDDESLAGAAARFIPNVGNAGKAALLDELGDAQREVVGIDLIRQFSNHQARAPVNFFHGNDRTHGDGPTTRAIHVDDALGAQYLGARGEIRALNADHQFGKKLFSYDLGVSKREQSRVRDLTEIVRWDVRGHAHGDSHGAINQQIRKAGRKNGGFLSTTVVVVLEVDGVFFDIAHHLESKRCHLCLGVSRSGSTVVTRRAKVSLAKSERVSQAPGLHEPNEGVIDGRVSVRVKLPHHVAHHAGALGECLVGSITAVEHGVNHPSMHGLQAVTHLGKCAAHDHAHRVVEVRALHLELKIDLLDAVGHWFGHVRGVVVRCQGNAHP